MVDLHATIQMSGIRSSSCYDPIEIIPIYANIDTVIDILWSVITASYSDISRMMYIIDPQSIFNVWRFYHTHATYILWSKIDNIIFLDMLPDGMETFFILENECFSCVVFFFTYLLIFYIKRCIFEIITPNTLSTADKICGEPYVWRRIDICTVEDFVWFGNMVRIGYFWTSFGDEKWVDNIGNIHIAESTIENIFGSKSYYKAEVHVLCSKDRISILAILIVSKMREYKRVW